MCVCVCVCVICVGVIRFYVIGILFQPVSEPYYLSTSSNLIRITFKLNRDYPSDAVSIRRKLIRIDCVFNCPQQ